MRPASRDRRPGGIGPWPALLAAALVGCGWNPAVDPPEAAARKALESALTSWRDDRPMSRSAASAVQFVDSRRMASGKLQAFEVVGEEPGDGPGKLFLVRLKLAEAGDEQESRYVVLGGKPIWVYRQEDFDRDVNMNGEPPPKPRKRKR